MKQKNHAIDETVIDEIVEEYIYLYGQKNTLTKKADKERAAARLDGIYYVLSRLGYAEKVNNYFG